MSKARDPIDVIDAVMGLVPADLAELRHKLTEIREDAFFIPPEDKGRVWMALQSTLERFLSEPLQRDWEFRISEIVRGKNQS